MTNTIAVELFYSGAWNNTVTDSDTGGYSRVRATSAGGGISIERGRRSEGGPAVPSRCQVMISNRDGKYTPRNPASSLYGLIGRNTPLRITVNSSVRFVGEVTQWPPRRDTSDNDRYVPIEAAGILRRMENADSPLQSALRTAVLATGPAAYWPLEDGANSVHAASGLPGGQQMTQSGGPVVNADVESPGSAPLPNWRTSTGRFRGPVGGVAHQFTVGFLIQYESINDWAAVRVTSPGGPYPTLTLTFADDIVLTGTDDSGDSTIGTIASDLSDGDPHWVALRVSESAGTVTYALWIDDAAPASFGTEAGDVAGGVSSVTVLSRAAGTSATLGHVAVWPTPADTVDQAPPAPLLYEAAVGYLGEPAGRRIERLCDEAGVASQAGGEYRITDDFDRTEASGWGDTTTGETWTAATAATDYHVDTTDGGVIEQSTATTVRAMTLDPGGDGKTFDVVAKLAMPVLQAGGAVGVWTGIVFRWTDATTHYRASLRHIADGADNNVFLELTDATGAGALLAGAQEIDLGLHDPGIAFYVRVRGSGNLFRARAWVATADEPTEWQVVGVDSTLATGDVGCYARRGTGDTTTGADIEFTDFATSGVLDDTEPMGTQQIATLLTEIRSAADTDAGILGEARDVLGLRYVPRASLYNAAAAATLDYSARQVAPPLEPTGDLFGLTNDVEATRSGGSSARAEQTTGPLAVATVGRVSTSVQVNPVSDLLLPHHAGWRLHLGTVDEDRVPTVPVNLANAALSGDAALTAAVRELIEGDRLDITDPPDDLPPDDIRMLVQGYTESVDQFVHALTFNTSPASPYVIAEVAHASRGVLQSASATTAEALDTTETGVDITAGAGPDWTHEADFDITIGGERMTVTAVGAMAGTFPARTCTLTVTRSVNGVVKSHASGAAVGFAEPAYIGL